MRTARHAALLLSFAVSPLGAATPAATSPASGAEEPTAQDLFFRLSDSYVGLAAYRDAGELEMRDGGAAGGGAGARAGAVRFRFTTELSPDGLVRFTVEPSGGARASAIEARRSSAAAPSGEATEASEPTFAERLDETVATGAAEALAVPRLLLSGPLALPDPELLATDGVEPCGDERCRVLVGARPADGLSFRFWIGEKDGLLRRSEVSIVRGGAERNFVASVRPFPEPSAESPVFREAITVSLASTTVRVVDDRGRVLEGLGVDDFRLLLGKREVPIASVEWVRESGAPSSPLAGTEVEAESGDEPARFDEPAGRYVLFFVQASLEPSRLGGQMRMREYARRFVESLPADDRVAVVSFDSHLKLRSDFTDDRLELFEALDAGWRVGPAPRLRARTSPSLVRTLDRDAAYRAASPERGLEVAAKALIPFAGEKVVVFLGWGLGRYTSTGVLMEPAYDDALRALEAARASVFALDVTDAASHSLEVGLMKVAADTGGIYEKTHVFPALAMRRLEEAIAGHYVLTFEPPAEPAGGADGDLTVELRDPRRGSVLARRSTTK